MLSAVLLFALSGCGGGATGSEGNDGQDTLRLTVVPDRINISDGGSCSVNVTLWDANAEPIIGTVYLASTFGKLGASSVTTVADPGGTTASAATTLTPSDTTTVGNAVVTATFGSITVWVSVEFYKTLG